MGSASKRQRKLKETDSGVEDFQDTDNHKLLAGKEEYFSDEGDDTEDEEIDEDEDEVEEEEGGNWSAEEGGGVPNDGHEDAEMEELEKEYMNLRQEQDILKNLKRQKDDDYLKGQAVKNQRALWDRSLELRFSLQKPFSNSNRLPKEPVKSSLCELDKGVKEAYSDLIASSKNTLDSLLELQETLFENNKSIIQATDDHSKGLLKHPESSKNLDAENDEYWTRVAQMHERIAPFRDKSIDKWHRKTQVTTGAAAIKGKLQAFNQNISEQVAAYMRDPSRMINQMQLRRSTVDIFGTGLEGVGSKEEEAQAETDPELLDDSEFYQQLLKEFFETIDPKSSETAFYALKKLQTKKRKIVDRHASKSRKIRYNIHEKIVNFMPPIPTDLHPAAPKFVQNIFGLRIQTQKSTTLV